MKPAADALEKLSHGIYGDPLVDVGWSNPYNIRIASYFQTLILFQGQFHKWVQPWAPAVELWRPFRVKTWKPWLTQYHLFQLFSRVCHLFQVCPASSACEAPNTLRLVAERPHRREMEAYRNADRLGALHRAAAKLWAKGVPMAEAMKIIRTSITECASS